MASTEEKAYEIMRELDVSYVLVIFGGLTGYSSDGMSTKPVEIINVHHPMDNHFVELLQLLIITAS